MDYRIIILEPILEIDDVFYESRDGFSGLTL